MSNDYTFTVEAPARGAGYSDRGFAEAGPQEMKSGQITVTSHSLRGAISYLLEETRVTFAETVSRNGGREHNLNWSR